ncbi:hypothetical protein IAQ61_000043 [Plenodomus lingam]|uniref:uncharacterized protein n=1 Tax=Leptosphaeria maculans TaxID=5022 RepID=UPI00331D03B6|nr:hypothetical protein IAQ61_000043 [Plenodomus lingam]
MFSPEASVQSARSSLRNPRRRPRKNSDGQQQQHRRKRSKLNDETFQDPEEMHMNGKSHDLMNGHAVQSVENSVVLVDMPVREKQAPPKRAAKEDHALYLTKNANYSVKKLPAFPNPLLRLHTPFHGTALSSAGLALALTHERAIVWDYNAINDPTKVVALPLRFGLKASDPLPLGAIVRNGPTNDYGIVALAPSSGRISFWENIDSADTRSMYPQRRQGVEGSAKLYSGESITALVEAEHAGYVLIFSSGRLAHLTLRDAQGRPHITTTIMSALNHSNGSFFSFKGLLGAPVRKAIASVKARPSSSKGHMEVISATRNGLFQTWDLSWSGQHNHQRDIDVQADILAAVQADVAVETRGQQDVRVLDFAIMEKQQSRDVTSLLVLVALSGRESLNYSLLEIDLGKASATINRVIPVRNFNQTTLPKEPKGTLLLPQPGHTAYVEFPGAIFVASLVQPEESPEAQLLADSGSVSLPFQDSIYFRDDMSIVLSGTALEQPTRKDPRAAALIFVQGFGLLQISAQPPTTNEEETERMKVTARSKLEQATFFSTVPGNILDFSVKSRFSFSEEETAKAAVYISSEILKSSYEYLDKVTSSMDDQFRKRASALKTLASQLQSDYTPLSTQTKWRLLWHAEKLAATHALWTWYQKKLGEQQKNPDAFPEPILMGDIVRALNERYKTAINPEIGETDAIRQFFLRDVESLGILLPWAWFYLRTFYMKDGVKEPRSIMQRVSEGNDVIYETLSEAFRFRAANLELYGLDPDCLEDGVLKPNHGYDLLPQFWTSSHNIVSSIRSLIDVGRNLAVENFEEGHQESLAQKIGNDNPKLVKLGCQTHIERFQWALAQNDEKTRETGRNVRSEWNKNVRPNHILGLMEIGLATEGMSLAEQYHDMDTLVDLVWEESNWLENEKANTRSKMEQAESTIKLGRIKDRITRYFQTYGDEWARAFYSKYIKENQAAQLFMREYLNQPALTKFLRADASRARIAWIHEVATEKNYEAAAASLYEASTKQETNAWCQRVELSIAKLAMLCKDEKKEGEKFKTTTPPPKNKAEKMRENQFQSIKQQLEFTKIQDQVYDSLAHVIEGAADKDFAVDLLMTEFGQGRLKDRPAHQAILKEGFDNLVHHRVIDPALMIDILTLMNTDDSEEGVLPLQGNEFLFALRVLVISWHNIHRTTRDGLLKLVWKRLCLKDDWVAINNTKNVSDATLHDFLRHTAVGWTFQGLTKMIHEDPFAKVAWPKKLEELLGAGATHGELCVRFANEDIRNPIIKDNLLDDDLMREHLDKHRLAQWFTAACRAGQKTFQDSILPVRKPRPSNELANGVAAQSVLNETVAEAEPAPPAPGPIVLDSDMQSIADQGQEDVEMQYS